MKVTFNQTKYLYNINPIRYQKDTALRTQDSSNCETENSVSPNLSLVNFPNVSFGMNQDMVFLLNQAKRLRCAYSGLEMLTKNEAKNIYQGLSRRPNAQSAINLLQQYQKYMHDIESRIFDTFVDAPYKNKRNFQEILQELQPEALVRLRDKQERVYTGTDKIINSMSEPIANQVRQIRDESLQEIKNNLFSRKSPLEKIKNVQASGSDLDKVIKVYQAWYKSPASKNDIDAFIVKYAKKPHEAIAKRLISSSVASIEHIKPSSRRGSDNLSNFLLVSSDFNSSRQSMPLDEYIMLNDQIDFRKHLQRYVNDIIREVQSKKSPFEEKSWYPDSIRQAVSEETSGIIKLDTSSLRLTKNQIKENSCSQKLGQKFIVNKK